MTKIGLYLDGEPAGGALQHDITMMHAFAALREWGYEIVIGCGSDRWIEYFPNWDPAFIRMTPSRVARVLSKAWRTARLPMQIWRAITPHFDTPARAMLQQKCDLWVFSSSAAWSFQTPVRSLVTIHDLMHRYERRFPEAGGEYAYREALFRNLCRWATGVLVDSEMGGNMWPNRMARRSTKSMLCPILPPPAPLTPAPRPILSSVAHCQPNLSFTPPNFGRTKTMRGWSRPLPCYANVA